RNDFRASAAPMAFAVCTTIVLEAPGARSPIPVHVSRLVGTTLHVPVAGCVMTTHEPPDSGDGSWSVTVTLFHATGAPTWLLTTIVNVALSPTLIVAPSGVFTMFGDGALGGTICASTDHMLKKLFVG